MTRSWPSLRRMKASVMVNSTTGCTLRAGWGRRWAPCMHPTRPGLPAAAHAAPASGARAPSALPHAVLRGAHGKRERRWRHGRCCCLRGRALRRCTRSAQSRRAVLLELPGLVMSRWPIKRRNCSAAQADRAVWAPRRPPPPAWQGGAPVALDSPLGIIASYCLLTQRGHSIPMEGAMRQRPAAWNPRPRGRRHVVHAVVACANPNTRSLQMCDGSQGAS